MSCDDYYYGMHFIWWIIWIFLIIWIFAIPFDIPGQRNRKETALDILDRRYASGEIDLAEYEAKKKALKAGKTYRKKTY